MAAPLAAEVLGVGNATATAQAQLRALSAAIALVSTGIVAAGSSSTADLSNAFITNINALSSILAYYQVAFANLNGNATS